MGATINWRTVERNNPTLGVHTPQHFIEHCKKVFGDFPYVFAEKDLEKIQTLVDLDYGDPWEEIKDLIGQHGTIKVWDTY